MANTAPRNKAMAGPTEKSKKYANSRPPKEATMAATHAINIRKPQCAENRADIVAGIIRNENTTTTPAILTATVITMPTKACVARLVVETSSKKQIIFLKCAVSEVSRRRF